MAQWPIRTKRVELARRQGTQKRIHVNKHIISSNAKTDANNAAITVQTSAGSFNCREVLWNGPSRMVHDQIHPLSCGAKVWIETHAKLTIL